MSLHVTAATGLLSLRCYKVNAPRKKRACEVLTLSIRMSFIMCVCVCVADVSHMIHIIDTEHPWDVYSINSGHSEVISCLEWDQSGGQKVVRFSQFLCFVFCVFMGMFVYLLACMCVYCCMCLSPCLFAWLAAGVFCLCVFLGGFSPVYLLVCLPVFACCGRL